MNKSKKHIVLVTSEFPPQPGGIGNHAWLLAKHLAAKNCQVTVITDQRSVLGIEEKEFDKTLNFRVIRVAYRNWRWIMYADRIVKLFGLMRNVDCMMASGKFSLWMGCLVSFCFKRQYVAVLHGSEVNFTSPLKRMSVNRSLNRFNNLIAVSGFTKSLLEKEFQKRTVVIPNGIDLDQWDGKMGEPANWNGNPNFITVGNVTERKGQQNVIQILPVLLETYPNLQYHCVGLPTQKEAFLAKAKELQVDKQVYFHGRLDNESLVAALKASDIAVMLSSETKTGDVEGFGIALLEANYFGVPSLGAKGCGIQDAIDDGKSGKLVTYNNVVEIKKAIADILQNHEKYKQNAIVWAEAHDWNKIVKQYLEIVN